MLDIHRIMESLATRRPVFHSESDFQFALAWQIHESIPDCEVRLEFKPFPDERMYLDIWLPTLEIAIELKYLTRNLDIECGGERFVLTDGARDIESYDCVKDIQRLERITDWGSAEHGIAIVLTNDPWHWEGPRRQTIGDAFCLYEGRELMGEMAWATRAGRGSTQGRAESLLLEGSYDLRWENYSALPGSRSYGQLRYLAVEVYPGS